MIELLWVGEGLRQSRQKHGAKVLEKCYKDFSKMVFIGYDRRGCSCL